MLAMARLNGQEDILSNGAQVLGVTLETHKAYTYPQIHRSSVASRLDEFKFRSHSRLSLLRPKSNHLERTTSPHV